MSNLNLIFNFKGNKLTMQCQDTDKLKDVLQKFANKVQRNVDDLDFYINTIRLVPCDKTLFNLQIKTFYTINVVDKYQVYGG